MFLGKPEVETNTVAEEMFDGATEDLKTNSVMYYACHSTLFIAIFLSVSASCEPAVFFPCAEESERGALPSPAFFRAREEYGWLASKLKTVGGGGALYSKWSASCMASDVSVQA